jgi:hypothetical protein
MGVASHAVHSSGGEENGRGPDWAHCHMGRKRWGVRAAIVGHRWSAAGRSDGGGRRSGEQGIGTGGPIGEKVAHAPAREKRKWAQGREKGVGPAQERITIFLFLFKFQKKSTCFDSKADFLSSKNFK